MTTGMGALDGDLLAHILNLVDPLPTIHTNHKEVSSNFNVAVKQHMTYEQLKAYFQKGIKGDKLWYGGVLIDFVKRDSASKTVYPAYKELKLKASNDMDDMKDFENFIYSLIRKKMWSGQYQAAAHLANVDLLNGGSSSVGLVADAFHDQPVHMRFALALAQRIPADDLKPTDIVLSDLERDNLRRVFKDGYVHRFNQEAIATKRTDWLCWAFTNVACDMGPRDSHIFSQLRESFGRCNCNKFFHFN